jgi:glycosyltransferase involved in cell wall biosynthesis
MKIALLTKSLLPGLCGIADHSINLVGELSSAGERVFVVAGRGRETSVHVDVECDWNHQGLEELFQKLESLDLDHLILQFTPLMYVVEKNRDGHELEQFWKQCAQRWETSIIVHETYFRAWWHPKSWINGMKEKRLLRNMVELSRFVFSASQPLVDELRKWRSNANVVFLPIGSNFPIVEIDREATRSRYGIGPDEIVLVLFGGGNSLKWMRGHVDATDSLLVANNVRVRWLLLGGVPADWFSLNSPVIAPGMLTERALSEWLQLANIFLMPHYSGLCGKRGTLMTAMQHGLSVVGTRTAMTDAYWSEVEGVKLLKRSDSRAFAGQVLALARDHRLRKALGETNRDYFNDHFTWQTIARQLIESVH